jgi:hypothetical protein
VEIAIAEKRILEEEAERSEDFTGVEVAGTLDDNLTKKRNMMHASFSEIEGFQRARLFSTIANFEMARVSTKFWYHEKEVRKTTIAKSFHHEESPTARNAKSHREFLNDNVNRLRRIHR